MIIPDDMVSRWQDQAKQRQEEQDAADKVQAKKDFRDICFTILASIAVSALGIAYVSVASLTHNPSRLTSSN